MATTGNRWFPVVNIVVGALFLLGAVVQYNDPDPWRWIAIWAAAGLACLLAPRDPRLTFAPAIVGAAGLIWALFLIRSAGAPVMSPSRLVNEMSPDKPWIETSRETLGLGLIVLWMIVLTVVLVRRRGNPA